MTTFEMQEVDGKQVLFLVTKFPPMPSGLQDVAHRPATEEDKQTYSTAYAEFLKTGGKEATKAQTAPAQAPAAETPSEPPPEFMAGFASDATDTTDTSAHSHKKHKR